METLKELPFGNPTMIYYNGIKKYFCDTKQVEAYVVSCWSQFGMQCLSNGAIISFLIDNLPEDTALICCQADYHNENIPISLKKNFKRVVLLTRYIGIRNSIVVPGDDLFFTNPDYYYPKSDIPFDERINEVFWRGSCTAPHRKNVVLELKDISGCNVKMIKEHNYRDPYWNSLPPECFGERVDKDEYSKYRIWLSIEGWGTASDTTRALMSGCAVIYFRQTKPWFHSYLEHEENCIIIENDGEKLKYFIKKLLGDEDYTRKIATNGQTLARKIFKPEVYKEYILKQLSCLCY